MTPNRFTEAETALIEKISYGVVEKVMPRFQDAITKAVLEHSAIERGRVLWIKGFLFGLTGFVGILTAAFGWVAAKVVDHVFK